MNIPITRPFLPPLAEVKNLLEDVWDRNILTNNGPLVKELESSIGDKLGLDQFVFVSNGTIALQLSLKALNITQEVITTPFSYVASTSSISWEGCQPVFADIDPRTLNLNPAEVSKRITDKTQAILATHVYGNPCDIEGIAELAEHHSLKVIYDASHCFGSEYKGRSVLNYGDISTISFHATKPFHTVEGGGLICSSSDLKQRIEKLRNFGHDGPSNFDGLGINGKNSEMHAAVGLINLRYIDNILEKRLSDAQIYDRLLGNQIERPTLYPGSYSNRSYYPVIFGSETECLHVLNSLEDNYIYPRRYFFPILSDLPYVEKSSTPIAEDISRRVLCLPHYFDLHESQISRVCDVILSSL
jgi:dTDP-4-amino-4,6-dideoxygalactose transaminase